MKREVRASVRASLGSGEKLMVEWVLERLLSLADGSGTRRIHHW